MLNVSYIDLLSATLQKEYLCGYDILCIHAHGHRQVYD